MAHKIKDENELIHSLRKRKKQSERKKEKAKVDQKERKKDISK